MRGNQLGKMFSVTSFGESHSGALGVILDGVPPGLHVSEEALSEELRRRRPGLLQGSSERKESDEFEILSGIFEAKTLGTPIGIIVRNKDARPEDYEKWKSECRVGHADQTTLDKYGVRDYRGGGRASGRETVARVIAGYFAGLILPDVKVSLQTLKMGKLESADHTGKGQDFGPYGFPSPEQNEEAKAYLLKLQAEGDSVGAKIAVRVKNCPKALGEPVFDKLKADLSKALLSLGACVGVSFGAGEDFLNLKGSEMRKEHMGGIEGGISNGEEIYLELIFKPTSTVGKKAKEGRHDPCLVPRIFPVISSMIKIILADHHLRQRAYHD